jgi:hypothetical protein
LLYFFFLFLFFFTFTQTITTQFSKRRTNNNSTVTLLILLVLGHLAGKANESTGHIGLKILVTNNAVAGSSSIRKHGFRWWWWHWLWDEGVNVVGSPLFQTTKTEVSAALKPANLPSAMRTDNSEWNTVEAGFAGVGAALKADDLRTAGAFVGSALFKAGDSVGAGSTAKVPVWTTTADSRLMTGGAEARRTGNNVAGKTGGQAAHGDDDRTRVANLSNIHGNGILSDRGEELEVGTAHGWRGRRVGFWLKKRTRGKKGQRQGEVEKKRKRESGKQPKCKTVFCYESTKIFIWYFCAFVTKNSAFKFSSIFLSLSLSLSPPSLILKLLL